VTGQCWKEKNKGDRSMLKTEEQG